MSCYICLPEGVITSFTGICRHCNQAACGRPPQRLDKKFHGDVCSVFNCGTFFCENHLHTHPHSGPGISTTFSAIALSIGIDAVAAAAALANEERPVDVLRSDQRPGSKGRELLKKLNRYLNVVAPGAAALRGMIDRIPSDTFEFESIDQSEPNVSFHSEFFNRGALDAVSRMAIRTMWLAGSTLFPSGHTVTLLERLQPWGNALGTRNVVPAINLEDTHADWLTAALPDLVPWTVLESDWTGLPEESDAAALGLFLISKRDEDLGAKMATAY